jgi:hypothetical protein
MILEYLQPDASLLDGITVIIRALYYIATIGAAGLGLFGLVIVGNGARAACARTHCRRQYFQR